MFDSLAQRSVVEGREVRGQSARSVPSANSQKLVWEGLEDIGTIRSKEVNQNRVLSSQRTMTAVAPTSKKDVRFKGNPSFPVWM